MGYLSECFHCFHSGLGGRRGISQQVFSLGARGKAWDISASVFTVFTRADEGMRGIYQRVFSLFSLGARGEA